MFRCGGICYVGVGIMGAYGNGVLGMRNGRWKMENEGAHERRTRRAYSRKGGGKWRRLPASWRGFQQAAGDAASTLGDGRFARLVDSRWGQREPRPRLRAFMARGGERGGGWNVASLASATVSWVAMLVPAALGRDCLRWRRSAPRVCPYFLAHLVCGETAGGGR